jgi:hypothetical protein
VTDMNWERWARGSGIGFVVFLIVGFMLFGDAPKVDASGSDVATFYSDHSGRILTAVPIIGIGFVLFLWFAGAIANALRESGQGRLAATTLALAGALVGLQFVVQALGATLAFNVADAGDEGVLQAVNSLSWSADAFSSFLVAGVTLAATMGLWRAAIVPQWFGWFGLAATVLIALRGTAWASDGFWSPSGGYLYISLVAGLGWVIVASVLLFRAAPEVDRPSETVSARPA